LGNLTLLTKSLNSKVSNGPWETKRSALLEHNTVKLTGRLITATEAGTWDEAGIDKRSRELAQVLLTTWPVPSGHTGEVVDPQTKAQDWVELKHLVQAGLVEAGTVIKATHRDFVGITAVVAGDGFIELADKRFNSPSGAARAVRKRPTNGWYFWAVQDGRRLRDVRAQFLNRPSKDSPDMAAT
jgi:hypothetical protein